MLDAAELPDPLVLIWRISGMHQRLHLISHAGTVGEIAQKAGGVFSVGAASSIADCILSELRDTDPANKRNAGAGLCCSCCCRMPRLRELANALAGLLAAAMRDTGVCLTGAQVS